MIRVTVRSPQMPKYASLRRTYSAILRLRSPLRWVLATAVFAAGAGFFDWQADHPANGSFPIIRGMFLMMKWAAATATVTSVLVMILEVGTHRGRGKKVQAVPKNS